MARPRSSLAPTAAWIFPEPGDADPGSRYIPYRPDNGTWLKGRGSALALMTPARGAGMDVEMTPSTALEDVWI
jgi:hypothetical protein